MCVWKALDLNLFSVTRNGGAPQRNADSKSLTCEFSADETELVLSYRDDEGVLHVYRGPNDPSGKYVLKRDGRISGRASLHHEHRQEYLEGTLYDISGMISATVRVRLPASARDHRTWVRHLSLGSGPAQPAKQAGI